MDRSTRSQRPGWRFLTATYTLILLGLIFVKTAMIYPDPPGNGQPNQQQVNQLLAILNDSKSTEEEKHKAQYQLGELYYAVKNLNEAELYWAPMGDTYADLDEVLDPASATYLVDDGDFMSWKVASEQNSIAAAIEGLQKFLTTYPVSDRRAECRYTLGTLYEQSGDDEAALAQYNRVIHEHPSSPFVVKAQVQTGVITWHTGDHENAAKILRDVYDHNQQNPDGIGALVVLNQVLIDHQVGNCCGGTNCCTGTGIGIGIIDGTVSHFGEVYQNYSTLAGVGNPQQIQQAGVNLVHFTDFITRCRIDVIPIGLDPVIIVQQVVDTLKAIDNKSPSTVEAQLSLANYTFASQPDLGITQVKKLIEKAQKINSEDLTFRGYHALIRMYSSTQDFTSMRETIQASLNHVSDNARRQTLRLEQGFMQMNTLDIDGALQTFMELADDPDSSDDIKASAILYVAQSLQMLGKKEEAEKNYHRLIDNHPGSSAAVLAEQELDAVF